MLFDPHAAIVNRDTGRPIIERYRDPDQDPAAQPPTMLEVHVTHGLIVMRALDGKSDEDKAEKVKPEDFYKRFILSTRIMAAEKGESVELTIEEAALIKTLVARGWPVGIWGQVWAALDEVASSNKRVNGHDGAAARNRKPAPATAT